ncbi:MAG: hypothetical protein J6D34_12345 [Atopobiaceae bacterium]|nr:hypothetical protein [Atopobiaceae bacterium]
MAVEGTYKVSAELMGSKAEGTVKLVGDGANLQGNVEALGMSAPLMGGVATGSSFMGTIEGPTPLGTKRFKVEGTVTGDKISGRLKAGLLVASFSGTRIS